MQTMIAWSGVFLVFLENFNFKVYYKYLFLKFNKCTMIIEVIRTFHSKAPYKP